MERPPTARGHTRLHYQLTDTTMSTREERKTYQLGKWELRHKDGSTSTVELRTQAVARFIGAHFHELKLSGMTCLETYE